MNTPQVNSTRKTVRFFLSAMGKMDYEINTIYRPDPALSLAENKDEAMEAMAFIIRERYKDGSGCGVNFEVWEELEPTRYTRVAVNGARVNTEAQSA
jgi:hypothetical protein